MSTMPLPSVKLGRASHSVLKASREKNQKEMVLLEVPSIWGTLRYAKARAVAFTVL